MKLVYSIMDLPYPIKVYQVDQNFFNVCYGMQTKRNLGYIQTATEVGLCIMHALACDGKLNQPQEETE